MRLSNLMVPLSVVSFATSAQAGPVAYALCQSGCNQAAMVCYTAAGGIFGATLTIAAPAAILACNAAQGACMAGCAAMLPLPTP